MNPSGVIALITAALGVVETVAPALPTVLVEGQQVASDVKNIAGQIKALNPSNTIADIEALFAHVQTDLPTITSIVEASKSIVVAASK